MSDGHDLVIVGSGVAALVAAIAAVDAGLKPLIIEKAAVWGGTSAISGGGIWAPGNFLMAEQGTPDRFEDAQAYLHALLGADATDNARARADTFLRTIPHMVVSLARNGVRWVRDPVHPDYYPGVPGASAGRGLGSRIFDGTRLGPYFDTMRAKALPLPAFDLRSSGSLMRVYTGLGPFCHGASVVVRDRLARLAGKRPLGLGRALVGSLMEIALRKGVRIRLNTALRALHVEDGRVSGVVAETAQGNEIVPAFAGVILAAGGFARNTALRSEHQGLDGAHSSAIAEDQGDGLMAALAIGARIELQDNGWWMPTIMVDDDTPSITLGERALPGSMIVGSDGRRFMNEAQSYMSGGQQLRASGAPGSPHWLIFDSRFPRRYMLRQLSNSAARARMIANGNLATAPTVADLARQCGLPPHALSDCIDPFNAFARQGTDEDFGRGGNSYDRFWADPRNKPNPSLAEIRHAPFWAARIRLGDLGTAGGLVVDQESRVMGDDGAPIPGLYAAGNCAASPFGHSYPGGGATIASAAAFGFIAGRHSAESFRKASR